ncbi:calmodulin-binding transcription activator 2-like, partial [Rutidosis leptorrhynchoides]|uniref:calmodulin-binding transcription activator 2-like n=1 Tax=Rutidosis leptorrhynchoides TaxID=125765 RepID=UPI003A99F82B
MADRGSYGLGPRLDIQQLLAEAQHRWLRPAEICEVLRNYQKFQIATEPPTKPPSGSLFLFDRKVLRYFRKDGHIWRKKKDGKTVKEAHEKLKVGSVDVLHCYYAHGEENESFQRRSYWMLEPDMMHIVFVHYLEVKGTRSHAGVSRETDEASSSMHTGSAVSFSVQANHAKAPSDATSPTSTLSSLCEDADSGDSHQASSRFHSSPELPHMGSAPVMDKMGSGLPSPYFVHPPADGDQTAYPGVDQVSNAHAYNMREYEDGNNNVEAQRTLSLGSWEDVLKQSMSGGELLVSQDTLKGKNLLHNQSNWQIPYEDNSLDLPNWQTNPSSNLEFSYNLESGSLEQGTNASYTQNASQPFSSYFDQQDQQILHNNLQLLLAGGEPQSGRRENIENEILNERGVNKNFPAKHLLDGEESLKKVDSFSRWISKELGDVENLQMQSSSAIPWSSVEGGSVADDSSLSPSISQDQLYSIIDFSPKWAFTDSEIQVLITGTFLKNQAEILKYNWSCMFGEVEVPAVVLSDGILSCRAPPHNNGRVPFYITCSNRLASSEVREFDYRCGSTRDLNISDMYSSRTMEYLLHTRLEMLLTLKSFSPPSHLYENSREKQNLIMNLISLKEEEECYQIVETTSYEILQKLMKEKLYSWLLHKVTENGKGPNVLDDEGQGVLHLAAALGYDWAIKPTITAGVSINFRDSKGWSPLHWAAFCGREKTVAVLMSLGAASAALTDPSPSCPSGITPSDLASSNGHKGISGYLAEASLTNCLEYLTMNDSKEVVPERKAVQTVEERTATPENAGDMPDVLSLKDSLTAVRNATQAADRIHQVFRMQSFQRKQLNSNEFDASDEDALSLMAAKMYKFGQKQNDGVAQSHAAATQIQKKYRGWKKRKEFLLIRQRIVKIQ